MPDWRRDLSYDLIWSGSSWTLPTPLWFWLEPTPADTGPLRCFLCRPSYESMSVWWDCSCIDYQPNRVKLFPGHWPLCCCGHIAQEHNS